MTTPPDDTIKGMSYDIDDILAEVKRLDEEATPRWMQHDEYADALVTIDHPFESLLKIDQDGTALFARAIDCEAAADFRTVVPLLADAIRRFRGNASKQ